MLNERVEAKLLKQGRRGCPSNYFLLLLVTLFLILVTNIETETKTAQNAKSKTLGESLD